MPVVGPGEFCFSARDAVDPCQGAHPHVYVDRGCRESFSGAYGAQPGDDVADIVLGRRAAISQEVRRQFVEAFRRGGRFEEGPNPRMSLGQSEELGCVLAEVVERHLPLRLRGGVSDGGRV